MKPIYIIIIRYIVPGHDEIYWGGSDRSKAEKIFSNLLEEINNKSGRYGDYKLESVRILGKSGRDTILVNAKYISWS